MRQSVVFFVLSVLGFCLAPIRSRGLYRAATWVARFARPGEKITLPLRNDAQFVFGANDPYWLRVVSPFFQYETEIDVVLKKVVDTNYVFVDCGANLGYWSVLVSCTDYGKHPAVAIEPMSKTYEGLLANRDLNDSRFVSVNAAIYSKPGALLSFIGDDNAPSQVGAHAVSEVSEGTEGAIRTTTIDEVVQQQGWRDLPTVVKLDVEGAETSALEGAEIALQGDCLIMYEDHGSDRNCVASRWFFDRGIKVLFVRGSELVEVKTIGQISKLKKHTFIGYNFFAVTKGGELEKSLLR